jgi:uncharacterized membrane protein HdeD (DUF308 family)
MMMWDFEQSMMGTLSKNWWMLLIAGLAALVFGVLSFIYPGMTLAILVSFYGAYALVDGIFRVIASVNQGERGQPWGFLLISGIISILAGIVTFFYPGITAAVLYWIIAIWAIVHGILEIAAAIQFRRIVPHDWALALGGVLSILFGVLLFLYPASGILTLIWLIAIYAVLYGIVQIMLAVRVHNYSGSTVQAG